VFFKKLYVRIWLSVVLAVAVLTLLVGWAWRLAAEPPLREVVLRNQAGEVIGQGRPRTMRRASAAEGRPVDAERDDEPDVERRLPEPRGHFGNGPEFVVRMLDGQTLHMHMPRPPPSVWYRPPFGFFWSLVLVAVAVALATYPITRKLTRRLERLQNGVQQWGEGDLSTRVNESGQDEVADLGRRFNQAAERVQTLVQSHEALLASQKSLLANASHELRSPLTRIRMGLELMGSEASLASRLEISRNITELDQLIEEILLASRLDARDANLGTVESVDLIGLAAEECARVGAELLLDLDPAWRAAPTAAKGDAALPVQGVAKLLRRAVRNLLENAHRHAAGAITLGLSQVAGLAVIRVSDHGPGVPPDLRERIFEPFYRLPGATERDGGVGLGLALVKSITLRHGGSVHCEDRACGGACFVMQLPLDRSA
jgi:signal transduction histidine kinase